MKIVVTGFAPFNGRAKNSSWEVAQNLSIKGEAYELIVEQLPVSFKPMPLRLEALMEQHHPNVMVMLGQAGSCREIRLERVAINFADASIVDNEGYRPNEEALIPDAPAAYLSSLPLKQMKSVLTAEEIPVKISNTAGAYVCNCTYFHALHLQHTLYPHCKMLFVHLPLIEGVQEFKEGCFYAPLEEMTRATELLIKALAKL